MFLLIPFLLFSTIFLFLLINCGFLFGSDDSSDDSDSEKNQKSGATKTNARATPKVVASLKAPCKVAPSTSGSKAKRLKVDLKEQARQRLVASSSKKEGKLKRPKTKSNTKLKRQKAAPASRPLTPSGDAVPLPKMARAASRTKKTYVNPGPIIPDLKISSCVKNELIIYNPYLLMGAQVPKNNGMILVDNASYQEAIEEAKATGMLVHSTKPEPKASLVATKCKPSSVVAQDTVTFIVPESHIVKTQLGPSQPPPSTRKSQAKSRQRVSGQRSASRKTMPICSSSRKSSTNRPPRQKSSALRAPLTITAAKTSKTSKTTAKRVIAGKLVAAAPDNSTEAFFSTRSED